MADTALPPLSSSPDTTKDAARIGTSNDKSWAGWAISSFTNKITTANGEIQPTANGAKPVEAEPARSASVPRVTKPSPLAKETLRPAAHPLNRSMSEQPAPIAQEEDETDDVYDAWGAMDDDEDDQGQSKDDDPFSPAATTASSASFAPAPAAPKSAPVPYDDGGEPDFAGWLAAQSKSKKPLPKGLNKPASNTSASRTTSRSSSSKPKTVAAPAKKIDIKPKDEDVDDGWGDAWD